MVQIPKDQRWERNKGYPLTSYLEVECPRNRLVGVEETIQEAIAIIQKNIPNDHRVPPLALVRMYRGGKTTVLKLLYEYFENNDLNVLPIIISLNGEFKERKDENPINALIRIIACQFINITPHDIADNYICSQKDLLEYINLIANGRSVVLLIDELDKLSVPVDPEVSNFLKKHFLDENGRYLVFTSHVALDIDPVKSIKPQQVVNSLVAKDYLYQSSIAGGSDRSLEIIHMPRSTNKDLLRNMSAACAALTDVEITLYGGLPSLLLITKTRGEVQSMQKLSNTLTKDNNFLLLIKNENEKNEILCTFLKEGN